MKDEAVLILFNDDIVPDIRLLIDRFSIRNRIKLRRYVQFAQELSRFKIEGSLWRF